MSDTPRDVRKLSFFSLTVIGLALGAAIPLGCLFAAVRIGGVSLLAGSGLGATLALVTRTRRPWLIYLALMLGALTFVPLYQNWPPGDAWDVHPWHAAPPWVYGYLDGLRMLLYLVGIPWPFVRFGFHAPDPLPLAPQDGDDPQDESRKP